jgi:hypothetical protein
MVKRSRFTPIFIATLPTRTSGEGSLRRLLLVLEVRIRSSRRQLEAGSSGYSEESSVRAES